MKKFITTLLLLASLATGAKAPKKLTFYDGLFCSGKGDADFLRLIDESYAFFYPNPTVPNISMIYNPDWDTFTEGASWGAWWVQNSYGFSYSAIPTLEEPWFSTLQRSWDLFWTNQGDGIRKGGFTTDGKPSKHSELIAPDGSLGDCAAPGKIIYKQGDGNLKVHDWFYEATAAGVVVQAEILLASHDMQKALLYLPKMERACDFIERTRNPKNNLFLVGAASNLLAPSYAGVKLPDGIWGKAYLSGLSITYLAALDRMIELFKFTANQEKLNEYLRRQKITRESLSQLITPEGYFVKYVEPDGTLHGVPGQEKYGYLEGVANADAVALRVSGPKLAESIYKEIASFKEIRPFDFLLTNAPGLDDTYYSWGDANGSGLKGIWKFGEWVNGGVWATVEARAILMYYQLGKFEDIRRSAIRNMKWAKDFRMDAPWSQRGENTNNVWSDKGRNQENGVAVMVDNFAIPAATIRGIFDYEYRSDRLIIRPRVPQSIKEYVQKRPVRFGTKKIYLTCLNNGPKVESVKINDKAIKINSSDEINLIYEDLPAEARVEIVTSGNWPAEPATADYPQIPALELAGTVTSVTSLPETLKKPYELLTAMMDYLEKDQEASFDRSFVEAALESIRDCVKRESINPGAGYYRPITPERENGIQKFYEKTALSMYAGFEHRMLVYAQSLDDHEKHLAETFNQLKKKSEN